jgi:nitroreductase
MPVETVKTDNEVLDRVIRARRTHRRFQDHAPSDEMILAILDAGLHAPYAAAAVGESDDYFRRFFVVKKGSRTMDLLAPMVFEAATAAAEELTRAMEKNEQLRSRAAGFVNRLSAIRKLGMVPGVGTAPFYLVVAEKKGFPPVEQESLAHCMENMWLKATALGLGFQLVSITARMADNPDFCGILGIRPGEWALMGCATGYPADDLPPSVRPPVSGVSAWLG